MQKDAIQKLQIDAYIKEAIKNTPLLLAIISALLYSWGLFYRQGFLLHFGLTDALFPLSFEQTLLQGAFMMGGWVILFVFGIAIIYYIALYVIISLVNYTIKKDWCKRLMEKTTAWRGAKPNEHLKAESPLPYKMIFFSYCLLIVFLLWLVSSWYSYIIGTDAAKSRLEQYINDKDKATTTAITHKTLGPFEAHMITCSSSHCAFWIANDVKVYRLDEITSFVSKGKMPQILSENAITKRR